MHIVAIGLSGRGGIYEKKHKMYRMCGFIVYHGVFRDAIDTGADICKVQTRSGDTARRGTRHRGQQLFKEIESGGNRAGTQRHVHEDFTEARGIRS